MTTPTAPKSGMPFTRRTWNLLPQARRLFANSRNVADRLKTYCGIEAAPLYHPPPDARRNFIAAQAEDFLFYPSRLNALKRQRLVIEALALTRAKVRVRFCRDGYRPGYQEGCMALARRSRGPEPRGVVGHGISEPAKRDLYARSLGVLFPTLDEDYGYVTLEAMLAHKPVIACADSGGPLEFVVNRKTGLICDPAPQALAGAMDELWEDRDTRAAMGRGRPAALQRPANRLGHGSGEAAPVKVLILTSGVPFIRGGAEILADSCATRCARRGTRPKS
jgi:glycosyltransferase involved in cell wall biosynthesis